MMASIPSRCPWTLLLSSSAPRPKNQSAYLFILLLAAFACPAQTATMEEPNLLLLRPIFNGLELDATVDGEERNGVVYVDIADLAEALEERPPPSLMIAVPDLRDYFPAQFDIDLRTQRLLIFGRGETAIERRFQEEYEAIRYQPPLLEYPLVEPPPRRWLGMPFAVFRHRVGDDKNNNDLSSNSATLFGDLLMGDGYLSVHDHNDEGGMSLGWRRDGAGISAEHNFGSHIRLNGYTPQWRVFETEYPDNPVFVQFRGSSSSDGPWNASAQLRRRGWNSGFSVTRDGGNSIFGGFSVRPGEDSPLAGMSLSFQGSRIFGAREGGQESRIAARLYYRQFSLSAERRQNRGRDNRDSLRISKRLRIERIVLSLMGFADFEDAGRRNGGEISASRSFTAFDRQLRWSARHRRDFSSRAVNPPETASLSLSTSQRGKSTSVEWRRDFHVDRNELRLLWSHRLAGGKFARTVELAADDQDDWRVSLNFSYALAWDPQSRKLHLSHELERTGALSVCAHTSSGEPVPGVRFSDRKITLDEETGCTFMPSGGARQIAIDERSLPLRMKPERSRARFLTRPGNVTAADFTLIISSEVEGLLKMDGTPLSGMSMHLIKIGGKAEEAQMVRTVYDGYYLFSEVAPGEYLLRVGIDGPRREISVGEDEIVRVNFDL